jgi:hypothetical protein
MGALANQEQPVISEIPIAIISPAIPIRSRMVFSSIQWG